MITFLIIFKYQPKIIINNYTIITRNFNLLDVFLFFCLIKLKSKKKKKIIKDGGEKNETLRLGNLLEVRWDRSITPKRLDRGMKRSIFSFFF